MKFYIVKISQISQISHDFHCKVSLITDMSLIKFVDLHELYIQPVLLGSDLVGPYRRSTFVLCLLHHLFI